MTIISNLAVVFVVVVYLSPLRANYIEDVDKYVRCKIAKTTTSPPMWVSMFIVVGRGVYDVQIYAHILNLNV